MEEYVDISELETIFITNADGEEKEYVILFTFESDETGRKYVLYYDEEDEDPEAIAQIYDDEGHLFDIESEEELEMIQEVFNTFVAEEML